MSIEGSRKKILECLSWLELNALHHGKCDNGRIFCSAVENVEIVKLNERMNNGKKVRKPKQYPKLKDEKKNLFSLVNERVETVAVYLVFLLRELEEPLMTYRLFNFWLGSAEESSLDVLRERLFNLPRTNLTILQRLCLFLHKLCTAQLDPQGAAWGIARHFAPILARSKEELDDLEVVVQNTTKLTKLVFTLIQKYETIFHNLEEELSLSKPDGIERDRDMLLISDLQAPVPKNKVSHIVLCDPELMYVRAHIFKFFSLKELKHLAPVCQTWRRTVISVLYASFPTTLYSIRSHLLGAPGSSSRKSTSVSISSLSPLTIRSLRMQESLHQVLDNHEIYHANCASQTTELFSVMYWMQFKVLPKLTSMEVLCDMVRKTRSLVVLGEKLLESLVGLTEGLNRLIAFCGIRDGLDESTFLRALEEQLMKPQGNEPIHKDLIQRVTSRTTLLYNQVLRNTNSQGLIRFAKGVAKRLSFWLFQEPPKSRLLITDKTILAVLSRKNTSSWREETKIRLINGKYANLDNLISDPIKELRSLNVAVDTEDIYLKYVKLEEEILKNCEEFELLYKKFEIKIVILSKMVKSEIPKDMTTQHLKIVSPPKDTQMVKISRKILETYAEQHRLGYPTAQRGLVEYLCANHTDELLSILSNASEHVVIDCSNLELYAINLTDADLKGVNFSGSDLRFASFTNALLTNVVFDGADLSYSEITGAVVNKVSLAGTKYEGVEGGFLVELQLQMYCSRVQKKLIELNDLDTQLQQADNANSLDFLNKMSNSSLSILEDLKLLLSDKKTCESHCYQSRQAEALIIYLKSEYKLLKAEYTSKDGKTKLQTFLHRYSKAYNNNKNPLVEEIVKNEFLVDMTTFDFTTISLESINLSGMKLEPKSLLHATHLYKSLGINEDIKKDIQIEKYNYVCKRLNLVEITLDESEHLLQHGPAMDKITCNGHPPDLKALSSPELHAVCQRAYHSITINTLHREHINEQYNVSTDEEAEKMLLKILEHREFQLNKEVIALAQFLSLGRIYDDIGDTDLTTGDTGDIKRLYFEDLLPEHKKEIKAKIEAFNNRRENTYKTKNEAMRQAEQKILDTTLGDLYRPVDVTYDLGNPHLPPPLRRISYILNQQGNPDYELSIDMRDILQDHFAPQFAQIEIPAHANVIVTQDQLYKVFSKHQRNMRIREFQKIVKEGNLELVKKWLASGIPINEKSDVDGRTPIMDASFNEHYEITKLLLRAGADVNIPTNGGYLIMEGLCRISFADEIQRARMKRIIALLIQYGGQLDFHSAVALGDFHYVEQQLLTLNDRERVKLVNSSSHGEGTLHLATNYGHVSIVAYLLGKGAIPSLVNTDQKTPFDIACFLGHIKIAEILLNHNISNLKQSEKDSYLLMVAKAGYAPLVEILLRNKAYPNIHSAILLDNFEILASFLTGSNKQNNTVFRNIDMLIDDEKRTALHFAVTFNRTKTVKWLLEHRASVNVLMNNRKTPLLIACEQGFKDIVKILIDHDRSSLSLEPHQQWPPLCVAVNRGYTDIVKLLLEYNVDPNAQYCSRSALHVATERDNIAIVKLLLDSGAAMTMDNNNNTPLHLACTTGNMKIISMLLTAPLYMKNSSGKSPLDLLPPSPESEELKKWAKK